MLGLFAPGAQQTPSAFFDGQGAAGIRRMPAPRQRQGFDDLTIADDFQVIHGHNRAQRRSKLQFAAASFGQIQFVPHGFVSQSEIDERAVGCERMPLSQALQPRLHAQRTRRSSHVYSVQAHGPPQGSKIRHGICTSASGQAKATVQQAVPDRRGTLVVAESEHLQVVHLTQRNVHGKRVGQGFVRCRIGQAGKWMDVADHSTLRVRHVGYEGVGGIQARGGSVRVPNIVRDENVACEVQKANTGMELLSMEQKQIGRGSLIQSTREV